VPLLLAAALLLSACGRAATAVAPSPSPAETAVPPTASVVPLPSATAATATATLAPPTVVPTATPDAAAVAAARAAAAANAAQAQAVAHLGAGNTLRQAGNLSGALHEYATARALAPARSDIASSIATAQAMQAATAQAQLAAVVPVRLAIPAIGVNAPLELLGLTSDGAMEAPVGWWDAGWYRYGPLPGQSGNSVIAGHLDSTTGPALFWHLTSLEYGARVSVTLSNGQVEDFAVQRQVSYADSDAPLGQIFGPAGSANLNLITCGGTWNAAQHNYSNRTVVFTRKV
jgi:sortase (surface protein transpeptidase)